MLFKGKEYKVKDMRNIKMQEVSLLFAGDIMLGRKVGSSNNKNPFRKLKTILKNADITFANLENPLCNGLKQVKNKDYIFFAKSDRAKLLKPFNVLSLANNHIIDCKEQGIKSTVRALKKNNISFIGLNRKPLILKRKGIKIGFLAYCKDRKYLRKIRPCLINENIKSRSIRVNINLSYHSAYHYLFHINLF